MFEHQFDPRGRRLVDAENPCLIRAEVGDLRSPDPARNPEITKNNKLVLWIFFPALGRAFEA